MHEMSLAREVVAIACAAARAHDAGRVLRVRLRIGALAPVEPDALGFCFEAAARGTAVAGAALAIIHTEATGWCAACGASRVIVARGAACPDCGAAPLLVTGGEDFAVQDLEVA